MNVIRILKTASSQLLSRWFACRITSGKKSAEYGIRFSYPLYISLVGLGIFLTNPYILFVTASVAFLGVILPMHPFDYIYNFGVVRLIGTTHIPGRGSEMQVSSVVALLFNIGVIVLITYGIRINYTVMALVYVFTSIFFVILQLYSDKNLKHKL